ncbi:GntR family transcriptional regulator [Campylobacter sp. 2352 PW]|uniref:GntR family transcriptional regulator n=1 Tax=Campylobacter sp. 2352 PW TaxID=2735750 RepID=UPI0017E9B81F|nr:GntR family transcriptional regulator [Campylobacter lari]MCR8704807.1 GntR family transcriptional regulator [Campylobacter sp. 2352 PW]
MKKVKNKTLAEQVYDELERRIVFCEIEPGSILTEQGIANMLDVGRTPVREALLLLSKRYLVNISKAGIMVPQMNASLQMQLLEVRRVILKLCIECAIKRLTEDDKKAINELLNEIENYDEINFLSWLDKRQDVLAKASKNYFIYEELRNVQGISRRFWYRYAQNSQHDIVKEKHKNILKAVCQKNTEKALEYVDDIIDYFENFVKQYLI